MTSTILPNSPEPAPDPPVVSVIVPAYHASGFLKATIESVLRQTLRNWELIVVDDGSSDDTYSVAEAYAALDPRIRALRQPNGGPSRARNHGFEVSNPESPYLLFLDHDDLLVDDALETLKALLEANPSCVAAHGQIHPVDEHGESLPIEPFKKCFDRKGIIKGRLTPWQREWPTTFSVLTVLAGVIPTPGVVLLRRASFERAGLFDPSVRVVSDMDLWLRVAQLGDIAFVDRVTLYYRNFAGTMSTHVASMRRDERALRDRLAKSTDTAWEYRQTACLGWFYFEWQDGWEKVADAWSLMRRRDVVQAGKQVLRAVLCGGYCLYAAWWLARLAFQSRQPARVGSGRSWVVHPRAQDERSGGSGRSR